MKQWRAILMVGIAGVIAAQAWYLLLGLIEAITLWQSGRYSFLYAISVSLKKAPWWAFLIWIVGVALPLYWIDQRIESPRRRWLVLALFGAAVGFSGIAVMIANQESITIAAQPIFWAAVLMYTVVSWIALRGGLWLLENRKELRTLDPNHGILVCILHGEFRPPAHTAEAGFSGLVFRVVNDGSLRKVHVPQRCLRSPLIGGTIIGRHPWNLFSDLPCPQLLCPEQYNSIEVPCSHP